MNVNEHERPRPNVAGLSSLGQQAEMKLLLAGGWPPLKPLPVFKYESAAYRASIEFDKARGEWLCRKTFLPSNNVQEVRGGLAEVARSIPDIPAEAFSASLRTQQQRQELDREASRRLQTILEWKVNFENGALYSDLQNYLSEAQQQEIDDILRLTLTARQLQFSPKNVASVFDALSKAGGKLATLLEIARRNKTQQAADSAAGVEFAAPGAILQPLVSSVVPETVEDSAEERMPSVFPEQDQPTAPEPAVPTAPQANRIAPFEMPEPNPSSFVEEHYKKMNRPSSVAGVRPQVRTRRVESSTNRLENSTSRRHALEISGVHVAAFVVVFLFAVISLPIGLTVGRGPLGQWLRDIPQSLFAGHTAQTPPPEQGVAEISKTLTPSPAPLVDPDHSAEIGTSGSATLAEEEPAELAVHDEPSADTPSIVSNGLPAHESRHSVDRDTIPGGDGSAPHIARVAPPSAPATPPRPSKATSATHPWENRASHNLAPSSGASPHRATRSGILVTRPAHGSKPFRVNFPQEPIAASSSFAMASELSVLVPPEPWPAMSPQSSRLQAGELVYFVWPRYSRPGDRQGSAETVRVRATVGQSGQVLDVKLVSGSAALFPAARNAVHLWRYRPTLMNGGPIAVQQDITIEFRPPQYLSQVRTPHPPRN